MIEFKQETREKRKICRLESLMCFLEPKVHVKRENKGMTKVHGETATMEVAFSSLSFKPSKETREKEVACYQVRFTDVATENTGTPCFFFFCLWVAVYNFSRPLLCLHFCFVLRLFFVRRRKQMHGMTKLSSDYIGAWWSRLSVGTVYGRKGESNHGF